MKLFLKTFRLIGKNKNYEINFKTGLNFISGPTSTGKTTIFELIDYALGSKKHKDYIEISENCTHVELEILLNDSLYRIRRMLFDFRRPALVEVFNDERKIFENLGVYSVIDAEKENSLSNFILSKLGLAGAKISNQTFSFRDLFKFSYLKQTKIDNEDILSESHWAKFNKEKSTFEIIFNIYDQLLGDLRASLKKSQDEFRDEKIRYIGIEEFLKNSAIENYGSVEIKRGEINSQILALKEKLTYNTKQIKKEGQSDKLSELGDIVIAKKGIKTKLAIDFDNHEQYISKLRLLLNQYDNDIERLDAAIMGMKEINKYEFILCPNCLSPINFDINQNNCCMCNSSMDSLVENTILLKNEKRSITKKRNELDKHILVEIDRKDNTELQMKRVEEDIRHDERILEEIAEKYVSPFVSEISFINLKLGELYKELDELEDSLRFIKELNRLGLLLSDKEQEVENLEKQISERNTLNDKQTILGSLSEKFEEILKEFEFPKLDTGYINLKNYLPYVRNKKYKELGSLGAVTLITIAYYLSILIETTDDKTYNHLNLLLIDTPRKNLGATSNIEEFQDESIYNSMIKYFISIGNELSDKLQLIVINNGYPDFLPKEDIVAEFSPNGKVGLIDDI
ncbi:DNA recombination protein RecN [Lactococcus petauri]|uniref:DNA recombination protein RecN n=1 Tax=Lactococcus petauri TaxID=1940789 RepID=UPI00215A4D25|nr:DNA recombination protein RecN [Lactococcus petauri]MCR8688968.1 DNA recombination protein RecN [Lactococcus petauri]